MPKEKENDSPGNRKRTTDIWSDRRRIRFIRSALLENDDDDLLLGGGVFMFDL